MAQQRDPQITSFQVVRVDDNGAIFNDYGDLTFGDTDGVQHKIGVKRAKSLAPAIIPGRTVELSYAIYMNKEYIAKAKLYDGKPASPEISKPQPAKVEIPARISDGQSRGMLCKEFGDLLRAEKVEVLFGDKVGQQLIDWYRNEVLSIAKIDYDKSELPVFAKEKAPPAQPKPSLERTKSKNSPAVAETGSEPLSSGPDRLITVKEISNIGAIITKKGKTAAQLGRWMRDDKKWSVKKWSELKLWQYNEILEAFGQEKDIPF